MDMLIYIVPAAAVIALAFALILAGKVMKYSEGTEKMAEISANIRKGANAYLKRQYTGVAVFFVAMFILLLVLGFMDYVSMFTPFAFITGGFFSGLSGFLGMKIATAANARTANAAREGLNKGLRVAFSSGSVMGFVVVGLGLLDISVWYFLLKYAFGLNTADITAAMLTFGMGASSMALFARVGGGIFTKAADVGADLVGKVEAGIPEDDPRNPAVIADNVGDNVGDVAGMGADLYESYVGSIISTCALAVSAFTDEAMQTTAVILAMAIAAIGVFASVFGTFFVKTKEQATQKNLLTSLRKGTYISSALVVVISFLLVFFGMGTEYLGLFAAIISGLLAGILIGYFTEYYTSDTYNPTKELAGTTQTGSATVIIGGVSLGMKSTAIPVIIVGISVLISFFVSGGTMAEPALGLFGIGLSAVGMLSTLGITLATDAYGPVADNAGGIAEMAGLEKEVRQRTDALDSLGNTTAATGKGFAIGSAALTALTLIAAYVDKVSASGYAVDLSLTNPAVLIGLFVGGMLTFLFSSMTMSAVGRAAQSVVIEVRRQFKEIKGLLEGTATADYASCVDLCTRAAQKEMKAPAILGVVAPILVGLILGPSGVVGMLGGATVSGFLLAIMMSNSGGAWDNAKKYIEAGNFDGKGSKNHKAAVVGDTVGDPFKDTSGPSINILIKLLSMVSIVFAVVITKFNLLDWLVSIL